MRILYIASEFPYPANHGGRVDIWNRLQAMHTLGHSVFLVSWTELFKGDLPSAESLEKVRSKTSSLLTFKISRDFKRVLNLYKHPSFVAARLLSDKDYKDALTKATAFKPDVVFIDGIYAGTTGLKFAQDLKLPVGLRLHNIEHLYMKGQFILSKSLRLKLSLGIGLVHLKSYEESLVKKVSAFFDISKNDLNAWAKKGIKNGYWLPPIHRNSFTGQSTHADDLPIVPTNFDICFLGNLSTPNNVNGITWFINTVLPIINEQKPQVSFLIMGSNPNEAILNLCNNTEGVTLIRNPNYPEAYFKYSKVLINPVRFASGVNIKAIDMLFTDNQVVSTSYGVKGLPSQFEEVFAIADTPEDFSDKVLAAINGDTVNNPTLRQHLRDLFGLTNIEIIEDALLNKTT